MSILPPSPFPDWMHALTLQERRLVARLIKLEPLDTLFSDYH
jgi:hypothetical protein